MSTDNRTIAILDRAFTSDGEWVSLTFYTDQPDGKVSTASSRKAQTLVADNMAQLCAQLMQIAATGNVQSVEGLRQHLIATSRQDQP